MHATQIVRHHVSADPCNLAGARVLVEAEMNSAEDARIIDAISDLLELTVLELVWQSTACAASGSALPTMTRTRQRL
jgi:hypothetical protein